jgi:hypothetical protein
LHGLAHALLAQTVFTLPVRILLGVGASVGHLRTQAPVPPDGLQEGVLNRDHHEIRVFPRFDLARDGQPLPSTYR